MLKIVEQHIYYPTLKIYQPNPSWTIKWVVFPFPSHFICWEIESSPTKSYILCNPVLDFFKTPKFNLSTPLPPPSSWGPKNAEPMHRVDSFPSHPPPLSQNWQHHQKLQSYPWPQQFKYMTCRSDSSVCSLWPSPPRRPSMNPPRSELITAERGRRSVASGLLAPEFPEKNRCFP